MMANALQALTDAPYRDRIGNEMFTTGDQLRQAGWWTRLSPEHRELLRRNWERSVASEGNPTYETDPFATSADDPVWRGGNNLLANAGAVDWAYNPQTGEAVGLDANGNPLWESRYSTKQNDDAFTVAGLMAAGLAGGAAAGLGGSATAGASGIAPLTAAEMGTVAAIPEIGAGAAGGVAGASGIAPLASNAGGTVSSLPTIGQGVSGTAGPAGVGGGMDWAQLGASLVGPALQSYAVNKAAGTQAGATEAAIGEQRRQFDLTRGDLAPYRDTASWALPQLKTAVGRMPTAEEVMAQPGYQFGLGEGLKQVGRTAAMRGGRLSGPAIKAATRYATDYGTTKYKDEWARRNDIIAQLQSMAGIGQSAAGTTAQAGQNATNAISGLIANQGQNAAGGQLAQGSIWGNAANQTAAWWGRQRGNRDPNAINSLYGMPNYAIDPYGGG